MSAPLDIAQADPKGLIRESYRIEGITKGECRSIFLDWAINVPVGADPHEHIRFCLSHYGAPSHPMTEVLNEGLVAPTRTGRRGGAAARRRDESASDLT